MFPIMFVIIATIAATVSMSRIAGVSDMSSGKWGTITFCVCLGLGLTVPFPFSGLIIVLPLCYGLMIYSSVKAT